MKTQQTGSRKDPHPNEDTLALIIQCPGCGTQRAFRVNDSFANVLTRKSSGMRTDTFCETCNRRIAVQLCWTRRHPRWVAEKIIFANAVTVEDNFGLSPQEGGKTI